MYQRQEQSSDVMKDIDNRRIIYQARESVLVRRC
jgi:hypothetical protein